MLKIVVFNGGLGNQMFQYAFYLYLKKNHPFSVFAFNIEGSVNCHEGFQLDQVFCLDSMKLVNKYSKIKKHLPIILKLSKQIIQENSLKYDGHFFKDKELFAVYRGFWQSEKYFINIEKDIRNTFAFVRSAVNEKTHLLINQINEGNKVFVSVHIRRGDYLLEKDQRGLCSVQYYTKAIELISTKVINPTFIFFSDDMEWVRECVKAENCIYVDWNYGNNNWQDMYLMSLCNHNIIANSSFSWWGAWLNAHQDKIVIAPQRWFHNRENYDVLPDNWIRI